MKTIFIFTYGTLMEGRRNYEKYLKNKVISTKKAYILGELYHMENKNYPAFIKGEKDVQNTNVLSELVGYKAKKVYGEIHEIPDDKDLIKVLAELENCDNEDDFLNEYIREDLEVFDLEDRFYASLPVYVYNHKSKTAKDDIFIKVDSGDWNEYMDIANQGKKA